MSVGRCVIVVKGEKCLLLYKSRGVLDGLTVARLQRQHAVHGGNDQSVSHQSPNFAIHFRVEVLESSRLSICERKQTRRRD